MLSSRPKKKREKKEKENEEEEYQMIKALSEVLIVLLV
jgi:hypothetical protein